MLELKRTGKEVEREALFSVDGNEVTVPKEFSASFALQYVDRSRKSGLDNAASWLLETALGPEGYALLLGFEELEPADLEKVMGVLLDKVYGAMQAPKAPLKAV